ncbi:hypothetical protein ALP70_01652 [Pseudomonas savastanoi]|uniref:Uncharacterized protein n=1 Tax=Pseudomonas savastanoi TaxID=29438 RepID=A0A3M5BEQ7_PSESS|nr:hypothetical protein ALP70_01652 [Pseudomonas savastanoi]
MKTKNKKRRAMLIIPVPQKYKKNKISKGVNQEILDMGNASREHKAYCQFRDKIMYVLTKKVGEDIDLSILKNRCKGFSHNIPFGGEPPKFDGVNFKDYQEKCMPYAEQLAKLMVMTEIKYCIDNGMDPYDNVGIIEYNYSFTNEELQKSMEANTFDERRKALERIIHASLKYQLGPDYKVIIMPHAYKEGTTDAHVFISRFSKSGEFLENINNARRWQNNMKVIGNKFPGLIIPENLKTSNFDNEQASKKLSQRDFDFISSVVNSTDFKSINDFSHSDISFKYVRKNKYGADQYDERKYSIKQSHIKELKILYKGFEFDQSLLNIEAERKLRFAREADKFSEMYGIDLHDMKQHVKSIHASATDYKDFSEKLLEKGFDVQPTFFSKSGKFQGFTISHKGFKRFQAKATFFDIEIKKHFGLDFANKEDFDLLLNQAIKSNAAYAEISSSKLQLRPGETVEQWLERLKQYDSRFSNLMRRSGNSYYYKEGDIEAFVIDFQRGTATLYKPNDFTIKALADLFVSRGIESVELGGCDNPQHLQSILNIFARAGIEVTGPLVTEEHKHELERYKIETAMSTHAHELERFEKQCVDRNSKLINIKPFMTTNQKIFTYENIYAMLPYYAEYGVEIKDLDIKHFSENKDYLLDRYANNKSVVNYLNGIFKLENMTTEEKKEYLERRTNNKAFQPKSKSKI